MRELSKKGLTKVTKQEILTKVQSGKKVIEVAKEYGISDKTIYRWISAKSTNNQTLELSKLKRENEALLKLVGKLTYQQELKKKGFNFLIP